MSGIRYIIWGKEFIRICQCFFLILTATFVVSDNNSYSTYSLKIFFSSVILKKWMILNMPLDNLGELKTVVALLTFEHWKHNNWQYLNIQYSSPCSFPFLYIFLVCPQPNIFFSHICICVFVLESHCFINKYQHPNWKKSNVSLNARYA